MSWSHQIYSEEGILLTKSGLETKLLSLFLGTEPDDLRDHRAGEADRMVEIFNGRLRLNVRLFWTTEDAQEKQEA